MTGAWALAWKLQRWELATLTVFVGVLAVALLVIGWRMEDIQSAAPECWQLDPTGATPIPETCGASYQAYDAMRELGSFVAVGSTLSPFVLGMILGPPLVGREIEGRTAGIAWALSRSRARWLALRAVPIVGFALAALLVIGVAGGTLARQLAGGEPAFGSLTTPLPLLVARGALALGIGLAAGALIGRTLPAILASAVALVVIFVGLTMGMDAWMAAEARPLAQTEDTWAGSKIYDSGLRDDATGEVVTFAEYFSDNVVDETAEMPPPGMTMMAWQIPASQYATWMARETAFVGGLGAILAVGFVRVVLRRSPA